MAFIRGSAFLALFSAVAAVVVTAAASEHRSGSSLLRNLERRLAYSRIVGYQPRTKVTDHASLDEDQAALEEQLFLGNFLTARNVYEQGGHSKSYAKLTLVAPKGPAAFKAGTDVYGKTVDSGEVYGRLLEDAVWGEDNTKNITVLVEYSTSDVQSKSVGCQVGGLYTFYAANKAGCFIDSGSLMVLQHPDDPSSHSGGYKFDYHYDVRADNMNARTLQLLSTMANVTMRKGGEDCDICPYIDDFQLFYDYYGDTDYANKFWMAASHNGTAQFSKGRGIADFSKYAYKTGAAEAMAKGSVVLNVWMYVIRCLENAISQCMKECDLTECNNDPVHALDEAVAFYAGSREGEDGNGDGKFIWDMSNRNGQFFKTCGEFGNEEDGQSFVNYQVVKEFKKAQLFLLQGECEKAIEPKEYIVNNMKVPIIQGLLRTAYMRQYEYPKSQEEGDKLDAAGATYLAAILPYIHQCSVDDGRLILQHMHVGSSASSVDFQAIKKALERNYECLGIDCSDIGGLWTVNGYSKGAEPCGGVTADTANFEAEKAPDATASMVQQTAAVTGLIVGAMFASIVLVFVLIRRRKRRLKEKAATQRASNIAAVTEIA